MEIRHLTPADAAAFQVLRLTALRKEATSFGSSYEEEKDFPASTIEGRLAVKPDRGSFGAFEYDALVGIVVLGREDKIKRAHKAWIWSMYVAPRSRGKGIGRALLLEALTLARSVPEIQQVNLGVNARNAAAIRLYESVGFKVFGREPGALFISGVLYDELHMYLLLTGGPPPSLTG